MGDKDRGYAEGFGLGIANGDLGGDGIELTLVGYIQSRMCVRRHTEINVKLIEDSCYSIELAQENADRMSKTTTIRLRMNRILEIIADMFEVV